MKRVVIGLLGPILDNGAGPRRWERWRPTVALFQQEDLLADRFEMLYQNRFQTLADLIKTDIASVSPETEVNLHRIEFEDPWDFVEVYSALDDFARGYAFEPDGEEYLVHITTGTHVAQICLFLLTESHLIPGKLIQTSPPNKNAPSVAGTYDVIDLDLSRYDRLASRFSRERHDDISLLKSGIKTANPEFNRLIERIERVAGCSREPMLLMGPTGAGKSRLAHRIYELKRARRQVAGAFVEVNCATLRGDAAMSALFGHVKGAFTGAVKDRPGLLKAADGGMLFLDEVGELGLDEQAMLLRALEEGVFLPMGADRETSSIFQLICGTNRDLSERVRGGAFREDLLARINLWTFYLPGLRERPEDIEPNIAYELDRFEQLNHVHVTFNKEGRRRFLSFAESGEAFWKGNFRDLNGAVIRMATLASGGRITVDVVEEEIERLKRAWAVPAEVERPDEWKILQDVLGEGRVGAIDPFDRPQLAHVVQVCRESGTLSEAGRRLFSISRQSKRQVNDADRLRKYLARFDLDWQIVTEKRRS
jgi:transcriptional regulatory protein RtcR